MTHKKRLIITTCGTSLLTNSISQELRLLILQHANDIDNSKLSPTEKEQLEEHIQIRQNELLTTSVEQQQCLSAELNSLLRFYNNELNSTSDHHILICTDTWLGEATAKALAALLRAVGHSVDINKVQDLRTTCLNDFESGMSDLVKWCVDVVKGYRNNGYYTVFNLTGGFKSIQGFMQSLAMLYADETIYIFESGKELLHIPRLPVQLNVEDIIRQHLALFRRMAIGLPVSRAEVKQQKIPTTLIMTLEDQADFSIWGELVWAESRAILLSEKLYPPLSKKVTYSDAFIKSCAGLEKERLIIINERLDQLARCVESNYEYNPHSLDFKKLKTPPTNSTHEMDAWSDKDAKRIYAHFDKSQLVLDVLGKHL